MTILICEDQDHAASVDELIVDGLRDERGAIGSSWSGVYTDGERFGVLWDAPVAEVLGNPEEDPSLEVVEEDGWVAVI